MRVSDNGRDLGINRATSGNGTEGVVRHDQHAGQEQQVADATRMRVMPHGLRCAAGLHDLCATVGMLQQQGQDCADPRVVVDPNFDLGWHMTRLAMPKGSTWNDVLDFARVVLGSDDTDPDRTVFIRKIRQRAVPPDRQDAVLMGERRAWQADKQHDGSWYEH